MKRLECEEKIISPFFVITEGLYDCCGKNGSTMEYTAKLSEEFKCRVLGLEDIDVDLNGKHVTQKFVAELLTLFAESRTVLLTGIDLEDRCGDLMKTIGENKYEYFRFLQ